MPKSHLDWLGVASLWLGAIIMAIKAGGLPLIQGAPAWLASIWWNYIPIILVTLYVSVALYRALRPVPELNGRKKPTSGMWAAPTVVAVDAPVNPKFVMPTELRSKWTPDTSLNDALQYFATEGGQRQYHDTQKKLIDRLISALREGRVTAWGKGHPSDAEMLQITKRFWLNAEVTLTTNYAFSGTLNCGAFDVRMSMDELRLVWPPKTPRP